MDLEEYRKQFIEDLRFDAEHDGTEPEVQFISKALSELEQMQILEDPIPVSIDMSGYRGRKMSFDAYAYDQSDSSLILISSIFSNNLDNATTLTNTDINDTCAHMINFLDESVNGNMSKYCDDSDLALGLAKEFKNKIGITLQQSEIMRFRFIIISDHILSKQVKNVTQDDFLDRHVDLDIWTIERFYHSFTSNTSEVIEISTQDFGCDGIPYIKADLGSAVNYDAYLGIVPGRFLANIYLKYGSKLLQGNIRAFLSVRGKINKGIRDTIINHPSSFFTYNNGIAVVARSVRFSDDGTKIIFFKDLQIINGGQTTASLANAVFKKEDTRSGMDNLFVPMKLTVLNFDEEMTEEQVETYNSMTKKISQCANSQNAVTDADFFSNHPFHILMEKLSEKVTAPAVAGRPYGTIWFYERSRGKWEQAQMQLSTAQKNKYVEQHPKNQVIKKELLAKCMNTIAMNPHQVCQSSAINFSKFASIIEEMYDNHKEDINEEYFRKCVCSVIMFRDLDSIVNKASWYPKGGDKAQIVPYTIAKLIYILPNGKDIDWKTLWKQQTLYPTLANELEKIAYRTQEYLKEQAGGGLVRTISRNVSTWTNYRTEHFALSQDFIDSLISSEESKNEQQVARKAHKFEAKINAQVEIFNLGASYWNTIAKEVVNYGVSYGDIDFINNIATTIRRNSLPSDRQVARLLKVIEKIEDRGYIMPEK